MNDTNRARKTLGGWSAGVAAMLLLTACGDATIFEAGVYKGKVDESATERAAAERADALNERTAGQMDR